MIASTDVTLLADEAPSFIAYRFDRAYARRQRAFDLVVSFAAMVVGGPLLLAAAAAIWLEDRGPVLFKQRRVGQYGRLFTIYKLRTMSVASSVDAISPTSSSDSRITNVGRWLRKASIDELPQLLNVVRGDMAIVGPRPEMPFIVSRYQRWQHLRHLAKPGVTGLWQTTVRKNVPLHTTAATAIDIEYIRNASTSTDGRLVLRTFSVLISATGAY